MPKGLWARPTPAVAARNVRRCGIGATLAPMGASTGIIERLSNGDIAGAFSQLKAQAQAGDASAANQLDHIAHFTCGFAGINGPQSDFQASQLLDSNSLPPADGGWFRAVLEERNAFNQQLVNICQQSLDKNEIDAWVTAAAERGDPASHYSVWMFGGTHTRKLDDAQLRAAALGGYPWAQFSLGARTAGETPWIITGGEASDHPGDLLRAAAQTIPAAEVQAWQLIDAALQLQGYKGTDINVRIIRSASAILNSPTVTPKARTRADQFWQQYGEKILSGLGCTG